MGAIAVIKSIFGKGGASSAISAGTEILKSIDDLKMGDGEKSELRSKVVETLVQSQVASQQNVNAEIHSKHWLPANWRPLLATTWGFILTYTLWFGPMFGLPVVPLPPQFFELLVICITGYGSLRSVEKVAGSIVPAWTAKQQLKKMKLEMKGKE